MDLYHCEMESTADFITDAIMVHIGEARTGGVFSKPSFLLNDAQKALVKSKDHMKAIAKANELFASIRSHNTEMVKSIGRCKSKGRNAVEDKAKVAAWAKDVKGSIDKFLLIAKLGFPQLDVTVAAGTENKLYVMLNGQTRAVSLDDLVKWNTKLGIEEKELQTAIKTVNASK